MTDNTMNILPLISILVHWKQHETQTRKKFLTVGETCTTLSWPTLDFKEKTVISSGLSTDATLTSPPAVHWCRKTNQDKNLTAHMTCMIAPIQPSTKILPAWIQRLLCIHDRSWALWWRHHPGWCWNPWLVPSALGESAETPADAAWSAERHWTWQPHSSAPVHRKSKYTLKVILIQKTALWLCQTHSS